MLQIIINPINKNKLFTVESNTKNQLKTTIHININQGLCLGDVDVPPQHSSASRELARGRVLYHVKFEGGNLRVDQGGIREMLSDAARMKNGDFEGL
jgi:type II restriction enzyme